MLEAAWLTIDDKLVTINYVQQVVQMHEHSRYRHPMCKSANTTVPSVISTQSLGQRTASGFLWLFAQTLTTKILATLTQIILAWLLLPEDFGLIGLAYTATSLANLFQRAGAAELLVQRTNFRRWATPAHWFVMTGGVVSSCVMLILAPLAASLYGEPKLGGLIAVLALAAPIQAASVVPQSALLREMRFKIVSITNILQVIVRSGLSIVFAAMDFGAYSFVLPQPVAFATTTAALWWVARPPVRLQLQLRRWRLIIGDAFHTFGGDLCWTIVNNSDYIALGVFYNNDIVGQYFFAYSLSTVTIQVITQNLRQVLFPALIHLNEEPLRQASAFLAASRMLTIIGIPACILQCASAALILRLFFDERWEPAIPLLAVLSLGMTFRLLLGSSIAMLQAQGRFRVYFGAAATSAVTFLVAVFTAASLGGVLAVAISVATVNTAIGLTWLYLAVRSIRHGLPTVLDVLGRPTIAATIGVGLGYMTAQLTPIRHSNIMALTVLLLVSTCSYVLLIKWLAPGPSQDLLERFKSSFHRKMKPKLETE